MSIKSKIALALATLLWASAFVGIRAGLNEYSPSGLALFRFLIASGCMGIFYYRLPQKNRMSFIDVSAFLMIGAVGIGMYNISLNYGELAVSPGIASFVISQSPIITALLAIVFLGETLTLKRALGFIVSVIGVTVIMIGERSEVQWGVGVVYIFAATFAASLYTILQKPFLKKYHAIEVTSFVIWGGTLFLLLYAKHFIYDVSHASLSSTLTVAYLGVFPAALGYAAWTYALHEIPAARAASALYFMPFIATFMGWLFLNEAPMLLSILGGVIAIVGVVLVNRSYAYK